MIIGVTGYFAAGKDSFAEILMEKGLAHVSLSDMIRDAIRARGEEITIPNLTQTGNDLRAKFGPQVLAERALRKLPAEGDAVVTSIRHGKEVEALRSRPDFHMVFIDAPVRLRYERSLGRARPGDMTSFADFEAAEKAQMESKDPNAQQLARCRELADRVIMNDSDLEALGRKADALLSALRGT